MISEEKSVVLSLFEEGRNFYKKQKFQEALNCFHKALEIDPKDGPSIVYFSRCESYLKNPPPKDWDGVFTMTTK